MGASIHMGDWGLFRRNVQVTALAIPLAHLGHSGFSLGLRHYRLLRLSLGELADLLA